MSSLSSLPGSTPDPALPAFGAPRPLHRRLRGRPVLFESAYTWLVFVSSLDIMFTWTILRRGGYEANALAARIINDHGLHGMVLFKFSMVCFVIFLSEYVGRRRPASGRLLAWAAAVLSTIPVVVGIYLMLTRLPQ